MRNPPTPTPTPHIPLCKETWTALTLFLPSLILYMSQSHAHTASRLLFIYFYIASFLTSSVSQCLSLLTEDLGLLSSWTHLYPFILFLPLFAPPLHPFLLSPPQPLLTCFLSPKFNPHTHTHTHKQTHSHALTHHTLCTHLQIQSQTHCSQQHNI